MAKVLVSIPDQLLREIDARAKAAAETRSGYFRRLVEEDMEKDERRGREEAKRLMALIRADFGEMKDEPPANAAQLIREDRNSR